MTPVFDFAGLWAVVVDGPLQREPTVDEMIDIGRHVEAGQRAGRGLPDGLLEIPGVGMVRFVRQPWS